MLVVFALLFVSEMFCCLLDFLIEVSDSEFELYLCLFERVLLDFGVVEERLFFVIVTFFVSVSLFDFLNFVSQVVDATSNF